MDVHVTHAIKDETLRLPTGAYYMGRGDYDRGLSTGSGWKRGRLCWERVVSNTWRCCRG